MDTLASRIKEYARTRNTEEWLTVSVMTEAAIAEWLGDVTNFNKAIRKVEKEARRHIQGAYGRRLESW